MQKRFCSCGQEIWVQYVLSTSSSTLPPMFTNEVFGDVLHICPKCAQVININELR